MVYVKIIKRRKNIRDSVPKSIMHFMVNYAIESIENILISNLYRPQLHYRLFEESSDVLDQRKQCKYDIEYAIISNELEIIIQEITRGYRHY